MLGTLKTRLGILKTDIDLVLIFVANRKSRGASFEDKCEYTEIYTNMQKCAQIYIYKDKLSQQRTLTEGGLGVQSGNSWVTF